MPRGDGTGPMGMGPRTGRGAGFCAGYGVPGCATPMFGYGMGLGLGFGRGMGRGRGRGFCRTTLPMAGWPVGFRAGYPVPVDVPYTPTAVDEKTWLGREAEWLGQRLQEIQDRLTELESGE